MMNKPFHGLMRTVGLALVVCCSLFLNACVSIPEGIEAPVQNPLLVDVLDDPSVHRGKLVRWAGDIVALENADGESLVFVVAREVDGKGEPIVNDRSLGRFAIRLPAFTEPEIYEQGRKITVKGVLVDAIERKVGDFSYSYPVIDASAHYLWPKQVSYRPVRPYRYHWWYDDYYPWYWYPHYDY